MYAVSWRLLRQSEAVDRTACSDSDELLALYGVTYGRCSHGRTGLESPQVFARFCVERDEGSFPRGREKNAAGCRQHAMAQRSLVRLEVPNRLAVFRIDCPDARRRWRIVWAGSGCASALRPADILPAGFIGDGCARVLLAVFRVLQIEPSCDRAVRRRLKVGPADE